MKHVVMILAALAFSVSAQADEFTLTTEDVIEVTSEQPTPKPIEPELAGNCWDIRFSGTCKPHFAPEIEKLEQVACYVWESREGGGCRPR